MNETPTLEVVLNETCQISPTEKDREELILELKPIAEQLPIAVRYARTLEITSQAESEKAAEARAGIVLLCDRADTLIREFSSGLVERLFRLHRGWTGNIAKFTDPLNSAAKQIKQKIAAYHEAETRKAQELQAKLQAAADEKARKERERLEKEASKLKTPELKEQRLAEAAQIFAPVIQVATPKAPVKLQKRWTVQSVDKFCLCAGVVRDRSLAGFVEVNTQALVQSKAANSLLEVPGVVFKQVIV